MAVKLSKNPHDVNEVVERYIVLFLGASPDPIPSELHLQKELFVFLNVYKNLQEFIHFEKHYKGPYSQEIKEALESPMYLSNSWQLEDHKIRMTKEGQEVYKELVSFYKDDERFKQLLEAIKLTRRMYDKLSGDELLLLIYLTYPEYKVKSDVFDKLYAMRERLGSALLQKGIITANRYKEIIAGENVKRSCS
jgi:hypothetical protein